MIKNKPRSIGLLYEKLGLEPYFIKFDLWESLEREYFLSFLYDMEMIL